MCQAGLDDSVFLSDDPNPKPLNPKQLTMSKLGPSCRATWFDALTVCLDVGSTGQRFKLVSRCLGAIETVKAC